MYSKIQNHSPASHGKSSSKLIQYLDKENAEIKLENQYLILEGRENEVNPLAEESFFNQDFDLENLDGDGNNVSTFAAISQLDNNRGTQGLSVSNFYILNIAPNQNELLHIEKIAENELKRRGLIYEEIKDVPEAVLYYEDQKDQLIKVQLKSYTKDVMNEYARMMDREIYVNQENLPADKERAKMSVEIANRYDEFLISNNLKEVEPQILLEANPINSTLENSTILPVYIEELGQEIPLYLSNNKIEKEDTNKFIISEKYYNERLELAIEKFQLQKQPYNLSINSVKQLEKEDWVTFEQKHEKLENILKIKIQKSELQKVGEHFIISKDEFDKKYNNAIIKTAKNEFAEQYQNCKNQIDKADFLTKKEADKATDKIFIAELRENGILQTKEKEIINFKDAKIEKGEKESSLISIKIKEDKEIKFWVNNKDFEKVDNATISMEKQKGERLLQTAIKRDNLQNQMVEISYNKVKIEPKEITKDGKKINLDKISFETNKQGLKKPIHLTFNKDQVTKEGNKFFIEKYKFDNELNRAANKGILEQYGNIREEIKNQIWKKNGFDVEKRRLDGSDLLYFGKVEIQRTYSHKDKSVLKNREILREIKKLEKSPLLNSFKISNLDRELLRDKFTNEVIKEGVKKGGLQYHVHVAISRHEKTSLNPKDKVSISPNASQRDSKMSHGAKVGFDRMQFFKNQETIFDKKFDYSRPESEKISNKYLGSKNADFVKSAVRDSLLKSSGINQITSEITKPISLIKNEIMPIQIPIRIPKTPLGVAVKAIKVIKSLVVDRGLGY